MVAATRERTLSLRSRLRIWTFTVCSEIFNTEAICLFDSPCASPAAGDSLTLVTTGGGDAAFTLGNAGSVVDISTYEYTLLDNGNHSWSLAENRAQMTPSTTDVLNMAAAQPLVFDAELDTVRGRLGSVKGVNYDTAMWSSAINSRNNVTTDAGAGFEQTLTGLTLGIDSRFSREESSTTQAGVVWTF